MSLGDELVSSKKGIQAPVINIDESAEHLCYGCSKRNPIGLKLDFTDDKGIMRSEFTPDKFHQGWPGYTHGGILFSLLDEAGGFAVRKAGLNCVTAKSEIKYIRPAVTGKPIQITARITKKNKRLVETEAALSHADGSVIAKTISQWYVLSKLTD